jgi:hypothetical protein
MLIYKEGGIKPTKGKLLDYLSGSRLRMLRKAFLPCALTFLLLGCSSTPSIETFDFRMTKEEVTKILGKPMVPRGVAFNKFNQVVEVLEYDEYQPVDDKSKAITDTTFGKPASFYLFFYKNQLVLWGEADDWRDSAKLLYDTKFW